jgi:hypothetical protein
MKRITTVVLLLTITTALMAESVVPLSVSWNVVESRWEKTSDGRLLFIMNLNYPSRRLPSLSEEEYMACLHEYTRRHPDSKNAKVVNYLKTNPDLSKSPAVLVVEIALKNNRITPEQATVLLGEDSTDEEIGDILINIPEATLIDIRDDGTRVYALSDNHTRVVSPDGTVFDRITSDDDFYETLNKLKDYKIWTMPARYHMGDGTFENTVNLIYSDFDLDPERIIGREFTESGFLAMIYIKGGYMYYRSFDKIGQKMETASFMTPSVYRKNGFDKDTYFVAWWLGENGSGKPIDTESDESTRLDFNR